MDKKPCKTLVTSGCGFYSRGCCRYAVRDGYCKQHHPDSVMARAEKSSQKYRDDIANSTWAKLARAENRIKELEAQIAKLKGGE